MPRVQQSNIFVEIYLMTPGYVTQGDDTRCFLSICELENISEIAEFGTFGARSKN